MTKDGNTVFGNTSTISNTAKVAIVSNLQTGLNITSTATGQSRNTGFAVTQTLTN